MFYFYNENLVDDGILYFCFFITKSEVFIFLWVICVDKVVKFKYFFN
jgi:hypothetical protein